MLKNKVSTVYKLVRDGGIKNLYDYSWSGYRYWRRCVGRSAPRQMHIQPGGNHRQIDAIELFTNKYEAAERQAVARYLRRDIPVVELGGSMGVVACVTNRLLKIRRLTWSLRRILW